MSTNIPYLDEVWSVTHGCTKISAGCAHCYAARLSERFPHGGNFGDVLPRESQLDKPLHWRRPRRVGVCFMSDLFHEKVPEEFLDKVFAVMALTPQHTYLLLTKRPERMRAYLCTSGRVARVDVTAAAVTAGRSPTDIDVEGFVRSVAHDATYNPTWPLPNVWLGVSVENQETADERIPLLLETPAAHRWLSVEPLLEAVDLDPYIYSGEFPACGHGVCDCNSEMLTLPGLDWVVVGGESGPKARECKVGWVAELVNQCVEASVPVYVKQGSGPRPGMQGRIPDALWAVKELPEGWR